ncbi:MAG: M23 family metallopeptidase [Gammaproteobacteria bacterium]
MRLFFQSFLIVFYCFIATSLFAQVEVPKLSGNFIQGGLVFGEVDPGAIVTINNHQVRVSANGNFIVGFGRDYPATAILSVLKPDGSHSLHEYQVKPREYKVQHINGLPKLQVNPDNKSLVRIKREAENISLARKLDQDRVDFDEGFKWPAKGPITGVFGSQRVLNGEPRQPHYGIDIAAPVGTIVSAPAAGVVTYVEDMYFSGKTLVVDHGHNLSSSFLHLDKILVQVGDTVAQGEEIAHVGASGRVTGAHLDWRMNWHDQRIDPGLLMDLAP